MSKKSMGTISADVENDFRAEMKISAWVSELSPIEQCDLLRDIMMDAVEAYDAAVHLLQASFETKSATKQ